MSEEKFTSIGMIIDAPIEEVISLLKGLDLTSLTNIKKFLEVEYQRVEYTKKMLILSVEENKNTLEEVKPHLDNLYLVLQKIEDRCKVVHELITERGITTLVN